MLEVLGWIAAVTAFIGLVVYPIVGCGWELIRMCIWELHEMYNRKVKKNEAEI